MNTHRHLCVLLLLSMRDDFLPPVCSTSTRSQTKRRMSKYTYEGFKMENLNSLNSNERMKNMYNNILDSRNSFDVFHVMNPDMVDRSSPIYSKRRGGISSTCRDGFEITYSPCEQEEHSSSLLRDTSRYSSLCLHSTNESMHRTCLTRQHTKCSIQKRRRTLQKCRIFKMDKGYTNYYMRVHRKKQNILPLRRKKKKALRGGALTKEMNKSAITLFSIHPFKEVNEFGEFSTSIHPYPIGGSAQIILHTQEAQLQQVLPSEDTLDKPNKDKYLAYISHSIKKQERKVRCFEKNGDRMLDLVELVLYNRMKETFFLKERICDGERYKDLCPDVFFFDNDGRYLQHHSNRSGQLSR